jgi:hypothetical protein
MNRVSFRGLSHALLFGTKKAFKLELMTLFASCVAKFFYRKKRIQLNKLRVNNSGALPLTWKSKSLGGRTTQDFINDPKWAFASQLIYAFIQKRAIWNKNKYVHKFLNIEKGSLVYFPSAPITTLLLPAKRFENFLRAEQDFEYTTHSNLTTATNTLQEKIQFHTTQRVLKRLYRLSIKQYYKSDKITKKLKSRFPREPRYLGQSNNFSTQNVFATAGKTNHYYRNLFLKRHRNYLTNQWWNGHLTEYNIENTLMGEIDFRTCFIQSVNRLETHGVHAESRESKDPFPRRVFWRSTDSTDSRLSVDSVAKTKTIGDFLIDFPDADQYYNPIQQRWFSCNHQSTTATQKPSSYSWKTWFDLEKGLSSDIINHYVFETFSRTYMIFDDNRELLDHFVAKLTSKTMMQEIESIDHVRSILSVVQKHPRI